MLQFWTTLIGTAGVVGSLIFAGWQTRQLVQQTKIQNAIGDSAGERENLMLLQAINLRLLDRPHLRQYLYDDVPLPEEGTERSDAIAVAELMADALGSAVYSSERMRTPTSQAWKDCALHVIKHSPTLRHVIDTHPTWWPSLLPLRGRAADIDDQSAGDHSGQRSPVPPSARPLNNMVLDSVNRRTPPTLWHVRRLQEILPDVVRYGPPSCAAIVTQLD